MSSSTFLANTADFTGNGTGDGGAIQQSDPDGSFTVTNSILVENRLGIAGLPLRQCGVANGAAFTSGGFNLRQSGEACPGFGATGDAIVAPNLVRSGLVTALTAGPGVNHGGPCPATDITGKSRGPFAPCDVGAFESTIVPPSAAVADGAPVADTPAVRCPKGKKLKKGRCVKKKTKKRKKK